MAKKQKPEKHSGQSMKLLKRRWKSFNSAHKVLNLIILFVFLFTIFSYTTGQYYINKHKDEPTNIGVTFVPNYARYYGLDPKEVMDASIYELGIKRFRLVSYWKDIERTEGQYDFSELDWQFRKAEETGSKVSLALGLRQPRWPECHMPQWGLGTDREFWQPKLMTFIEKTVERYKDSPALISYQLENEFFLSVFGECPDFTRERLVEEYNLVKRLDPKTKLIVSRSNNWGGYPVNDPIPDEFAISIYKRVWDKTFTKRYVEYPYPPWFYSSIAGVQELMHGKPMIIHELQMEAWLPEGDYKMNRLSDIPEQRKTMDSERWKKRLEFGVATGMKDIDMWGVEWWYWQKVNGHPELWDTAKETLPKYR